MTVQYRTTGRVEDPKHTRATIHSTSRYRMRAGAHERTVIQPWSGPTDQQAKPSCVGHAIRGRVRSLTGYDLSAVDLWTDARRLEGNLTNPLVGCMASSAIQSLTKRGASPYRDGEDLRVTDLDVAQCDLRSDMAADAHRLPVSFRHSTIFGGLADMRAQVVDALAAGLVVVVGAGRRQGYLSAPPDVVLDSTYWGGSQNGHEEGIIGYHFDLDAFLIAGSWGPEWGGAVVDGNKYLGCVLVDAGAVLELSWDIDVFEARLL